MLRGLGERERIAALVVTVARELDAGGAPRALWEPLIARGLHEIGEKRDLVWARLAWLDRPLQPVLEGPIFVSRMRAAGRNSGAGLWKSK